MEKIMCSVANPPPPQATVKTVDAEQVFATDLEVEEADTNRLTFPRKLVVQAAFLQCKGALVKRLKISQVKYHNLIAFIKSVTMW